MSNKSLDKKKWKTTKLSKQKQMKKQRNIKNQNLLPCLNIALEFFFKRNPDKE